MFQTNRKYDRMAVRLSALIARLMAGEGLVLSHLVQEFNVSERTLQRDLRERLAYLGVEGRQGCYRLPINTLKAYRDKDVLTFVKQIGMTRLFPGLDSRLLGLLLTQQPHAPCLIWHHAHKISALQPTISINWCMPLPVSNLLAYSRLSVVLIHYNLINSFTVKVSGTYWRNTTSKYMSCC